ncbi:hypothetical protein DIPPA_26091 [Diplonema papillatum]|nr:hypothetical protein DIPPA_26091 [Diplonema papillatum]KAJ9465098.1 hypothetical protein DIPPA_26091 [Diplonema papillatum]
MFTPSKFAAASSFLTVPSALVSQKRFVGKGRQHYAPRSDPVRMLKKFNTLDLDTPKNTRLIVRQSGAMTGADWIKKNRMSPQYDVQRVAGVELRRLSTKNDPDAVKRLRKARIETAEAIKDRVEGRVQKNMPWVPGSVNWAAKGDKRTSRYTPILDDMVSYMPEAAPAPSFDTEGAAPAAQTPASLRSALLESGSFDLLRAERTLQTRGDSTVAVARVETEDAARPVVENRRELEYRVDIENAGAIALNQKIIKSEKGRRNGYVSDENRPAPAELGPEIVNIHRNQPPNLRRPKSVGDTLVQRRRAKLPVVGMQNVAHYNKGLYR